MILLWGLPEDDPLRAVYEALLARGAPVLFLNQYQVLNCALSWRVDGQISGLLRVGARSVALEEIAAAYIRPYDSGTLRLRGRAPSRAAALRHARAMDAALYTWLEIADALVVNPLEAMAENMSKPYHAVQIRAAGFEIPETLVTTDPAAVSRFWRQHGTVVYKSISGVRSIVARLTDAHRERLTNVRWCPTQFQAYVPGTDVRVHVVGEQLFASEIVSEADDYRYAGRDGSAGRVEIRPYDLPDECQRRCRELARRLRLHLTGIDLRRTPDGRWYCFEANPSPGFTFYQAHTGQVMDQAVADLLEQGRSCVTSRQGASIIGSAGSRPAITGSAGISSTLLRSRLRERHEGRAGAESRSSQTRITDDTGVSVPIQGAGRHQRRRALVPGKRP